MKITHYLIVACIILMQVACAKKQSTTTFKKIKNDCKLCTDDVIAFKNDSLKLYLGKKYGVVVKRDEENWDDFFVTKNFKIEDKQASLSFQDVLFSIIDKENSFFLGISDNYLFIQSSTSASASQIYVVNMQTGKIIQTLSTNGDMPTLKNNQLFYWMWSQSKNSGCSEFDKPIEELVYNLATEKTAKTGKKDCRYSE